MRRLRIPALIVVLALLCAGAAAALLDASAAESQPLRVPDDRPAALVRANNTPFSSSSLIVGARWSTRRYDPPPLQYGDILPTTWAGDGGLYTMVNDGGLRPQQSNVQWKNSLVRLDGQPPRLRPHLVGRGNALGPYYSLGLISAGGTLYATRTRDWDWPHFRPFVGLGGMGYSTDRGRHWTLTGRGFPARAGNLSWVQEGRDQVNPDGYLYAISSDREFNADHLFVGRTRAGPGNVTDPSRWEWLDGVQGDQPRWRPDLAGAAGTFTWARHITYPQMTYVPGLHRYLLSFSYSYRNDHRPLTYTGGAELVVLEASHPWGPFHFVFREPYWGPSNGYGGSFPITWQSADGRDLWMYWAANWDKNDGGCSPGLKCTGKYGMNLRRVHLTLAG